MYVIKRLSSRNNKIRGQQRVLAGLSQVNWNPSQWPTYYKSGKKLCPVYWSKFGVKRFQSLYPLHRPLLNQSRPVCTAVDPIGGSTCVNQIKNFFDNDRYRGLIEAINLDTRIRLNVEQFDRLVLEFGFQHEEAQNVRSKLHELGEIMDFGRTHKAVIIKPERVLKSWEESTKVKFTYVSRFIDERKIELEALREKFKPLLAQANKIDQEADRYADLAMKGMFTYAVGYSGIVTYLIFWLLSWDIMEPASYLLALGNLLIALYFFIVTRTEFSFEAVRDTIKLYKRYQLIKKQSFDEAEYQKILKLIEEAETDLHNPEWFILNEVSNEMNGVKLPDPLKFSQEHGHFES